VALQTVFDELQLAEQGVDGVECIRLRNMRVLNVVPLEPLDGDRLNDLVESFKFHDPKHLVLETRSKEEEFAVFEAEKISLRLIEFDAAEMEWKKEAVVQIEGDGTIGALRAVAAQKVGVGDADRVRMAYCTEGLALLLSDDAKRLKHDERILDGHSVHFEVAPEGTNHREGNSPMLKHFDDALNSMHLMFNKLEFERGAENIFTESIEVDVRTTVGALRERLAERLGLNPNELVLRKGWHQQELKDNAKTLQEYRLSTNGQLFVEKGRPLKTTEFLFQIFIEDEVYKQKKAALEQKKWAEFVQSEREKEELKEDGDGDGDADGGGDGDGSKKEAATETAKSAASAASESASLGDAFLFVGDCILDGEWPMDRVKRTITENVAGVPAANKMRLRSFNDHNRLMKVYLDSKTLRGNLRRSIKDFTQICCQETAAVDEHLTEDMLLLAVARWYPKRMDIGPPIELALKKKTKIKSELRTELSKMSGIPLEFIRCEHPRPYLLKKPENRRQICVLDWDNTACGDGSTLSGKQWKCKSGDFVLFKDCRETELLTKEDFQTKSISFLPAAREEALVFYSPQQQIEREQQQQREQKEKQEELERAQQDAIERMKQSKEVAAKAALKSMENAMETE